MTDIIHAIHIDPVKQSLDVIPFHEHTLSIFLGLVFNYETPLLWDALGDRIFYAPYEELPEGTPSFRIDGVLRPMFGSGLILGGGNHAPRVPFITWLDRVHFDFQFYT